MKRRKYVMAIFLLVALAGCKTKYITEYQTIEVPVVHTEYRTDTIRDSVHHTDSVMVYQRGDTIFHDRVKTITKWRDRVKVVNTTDTITKVVEKPVKVEVERPLTKWEQAKMDIGGMAMGAVLLMAIAAIVYAVIRIRRMAKPLP